MELMLPKTELTLPFSYECSSLQLYPVMVDFLCDNRISDGHWHNYVQIWYTVSGTYSISVNGVKKRQTAGSLAIIHPFAEHQIDSSDSDLSNLRVINCSFAFDVFSKGFLNYRPLNFSVSTYNLTPLPVFLHFYGDEKQHVDALFYDMLSLFYRDRIKNSKQIFRNINIILEYCTYNLPKISKDVISAKAENALCINNAVSFMTTNYSDKISVGEVCEYATMSRRSFLEYFKKVTDKTCHNYLVRIRIVRAINKMRNTTKTMSEISDECGFSSSSHFSKIISNSFSLVPTDLKKNLNNWDKQYHDRLWLNRAEYYMKSGKIYIE